jgi:type II secretory pathway component PulF
MSRPLVCAARRAALFRRLDCADSGPVELDRMFRLLGEGRDTAARAQMTGLAAQFADGQSALMEALRRTGHFIDWELEVMRVALAAGDVRAAYRYLAAHYERVAAFGQQVRRELLLPALVYLVVCLGLPALAVMEGRLAVGAALALALVPLLLSASAGLAMILLAQRWRAGTLAHGWIDSCYRLPGVGRLLAMQQSLHYFNSLALCTGGGLPLAQSLRLSAAALPYSPRRLAFERLHTSVAAGGRLSDALRQSGALEGVQMRGVQGAGETTGVALAQKVLTESTRQSVIQAMAVCARWLPLTLLMLLPLVLMANLWVMGLA